VLSSVQICSKAFTERAKLKLGGTEVLEEELLEILLLD
jgi:hypothetical protein